MGLAPFKEVTNEARTIAKSAIVEHFLCKWKEVMDAAAVEVCAMVEVVK